MTASEGVGRSDSTTGSVRLVPGAGAPAASLVPAEEYVSSPAPRLGRGIVWRDIVAEIEGDRLSRMRDAA